MCVERRQKIVEVVVKVNEPRGAVHEKREMTSGARRTKGVTWIVWVEGRCCCYDEHCQNQKQKHCSSPHCRCHLHPKEERTR